MVKTTSLVQRSPQGHAAVDSDGRQRWSILGPAGRRGQVQQVPLWKDLPKMDGLFHAVMAIYQL